MNNAQGRVDGSVFTGGVGLDCGILTGRRAGVETGGRRRLYAPGLTASGRGS
jgi:hypothetical protein